MNILLDDKELEQCVGGCKAFGAALSIGARAALGKGVGGIPGIRDPRTQGEVVKNFRQGVCS